MNQPQPTATFAAAPEVMGHPGAAGMGLTVVSLGMNLGLLVGPIVVGLLMRWLGWTMTGHWPVPMGLLGFAAAWPVKVR
jgi:hypothetical protein